jgi:hypothetical protein
LKFSEREFKEVKFLHCHDGCKNIFMAKGGAGLAEGPFKELVGI